MRENNPSNWQLAKRLLGQIKPFFGTYIILNLTAFGREGIYSLIAPLLIMLIIDYVLVPVAPAQTNWFLELVREWTGFNDRVGLLTVLFLLVVLLAVLRGVFTVIHRVSRGILKENILRKLRSELYHSLVNKSFSYLNRVRTGQIISRMTSDMAAIDLFYSEAVRETFRHSLQFIIALIILALTNPPLTLISCLPLPVVFFSMRLYSSRVRPYMAASKSQFDSVNSVLIEGITAQKLIKGFGQEKTFANRFEEENRTYVSKTLQTSRLQALYSPSGNVITATGIALILMFGGTMVMEGQLTLGELVLFASLFTQLVGPVRMFSRIIDQYNDGVISARRVFEVIDQGGDVPEKENPIELPRLRGDIEFKNVTFSYGGSSETLRDISLSIKSGEKVAIIGFVGSGKSALTELVPRFYDVSSGAVLIDGFNVKDVSLKSLRRQIGIVLQNVYIFSTTIRENITFGRPNASDDEMIKAAKAAQIHEYIVTLPKGYDTLVGERGLTLSGGQRQRIAIARALLTDPSILILDDSTSNVDAETEILIRKAIDALLEGRTSLIITQRASTCESADKIVVVDQGTVKAVGKHVELIQNCEEYRMLIESQSLTMKQEAAT